MKTYIKSLLLSYLTLCCTGLKIELSKDISASNCTVLLNSLEVSYEKAEFKVHHCSVFFFVCFLNF